MIGGFIIEGADQSGKSHVCQRLHEITGFRIHHFSRPAANTDFKMEYVAPLLESDSPIIFDRSYVSEMVYGELFRHASGVTPEIQKYVERVLTERKYVLVYLKRKNYKWIDREEMYTEQDNLKVIEKYDEIYPTITMPKIMVDSFDANCIGDIFEFRSSIYGTGDIRNNFSI